jgi:hypothetical protein
VYHSKPLQSNHPKPFYETQTILKSHFKTNSKPTQIPKPLFPDCSQPSPDRGPGQDLVPEPPRQVEEGQGRDRARIRDIRLRLRVDRKRASRNVRCGIGGRRKSVRVVENRRPHSCPRDQTVCHEKSGYYLKALFTRKMTFLPTSKPFL